MAENYQKIVDNLFAKRYCLKSKNRTVTGNVKEAAGEPANSSHGLPDPEFFLSAMNSFDSSDHLEDHLRGRTMGGDHECQITEQSGELENIVLLGNQFVELKRTLNEAKNELSDKDMGQWHDHTKRTNPTGLVVAEVRQRLRVELCTQAWCKFYEILVAFPNLVRSRGKFRSLHLCEAPGAFISALNYYLRKKGLWITEWDWRANSLNPYYEGNPYNCMVGDDRLIFRTLRRWIFGSDDTGDVTSPHLLDSLIRCGQFDLVTADGSIDCQDDPNGQERLLISLHYCETVCALHALCEGGNFVLKRFTMFEWSSIMLLYLLCSTFDEVHLFKPTTSKSGNSEVYIICESYRRPSSSYLSNLRSCFNRASISSVLHRSDFMEKIPVWFLQNIFDAQKFFIDHQLAMVQFNLTTFRNWTPDLETQCNTTRTDVVSKFMTITNLLSMENASSSAIRDLSMEHTTPEPPWLKSMPWQKRYGTYDQRNPERGKSHRFILQNAADQLNLLRDRLSIGGGLEYRTFIINGYTCPLASAEWYQDQTGMQPERVYGIRLSRVVNSKLCHGSVMMTYNELRSIGEHDGTLLGKHEYKLEELELCQFVDCSSNNNNNSGTSALSSLAKDQDCVWLDLTSNSMTKLDWLNLLITLTSSENPPQSVEFTRSRLLILTRFSANILAILCVCYEQVTLIARNNPAGMCTIKAENYRPLPAAYAQNFRSYLRRVKYALTKQEKAPSKDQAMDLLQFLPMHYLTEPTLYSKLQRFNNTVLLRICQEMLEDVTHSKFPQETV